MQNYTAILKQEGPWWIGWIEEIPGVNCQESTKEELLESLQVTLREAISMNREDALRMAAADYIEEQIAV
jgi:predicted RNase H-like HicB family nuclease